MNIDESIRIINEARDNEKLVFFVGSGVSMNSNYPSWNDLIKNYAEPLGVIKDNYYADEYLKIPQYYYNRYGVINYFNIINKQFEHNMSTNPIHKLLFDLNPSEVVTTNFDDLLEKAADEYGAKFDTIKQDSDVPHSQRINNIIKMHGDLNLRNIVFKEDDYLSYSTNFPIIENYVRSLIATRTVLFIGYSFNDPDVKLLFQWVKDILGNNRKRAYLLCPDTSMDGGMDIIDPEIEYEYYLNQGIEILYYKNIESEELISDIRESNQTQLSSMKSNKGENLYILLKYIIDRKNEKYVSVVERICDLIKPYKKIRSLRVDTIRDVLRIEGYMELTNNFDLDSHENNLIIDFINYVKEIQETVKSSKEINEQILEAVKFFQKAGAKRLTATKRISNSEFKEFNLDFSEFIIGDTDENNFIWEILLFDYKGLRARINNGLFLFIEDDYNRLSAKAYCHYKLGDYKKAYDVLENVSGSLRCNGESLLYYINQFNQYYLLKLLSWNWDFRTSEEEREDYRLRLDQIKLDDLFLNLNGKEKVVAKDLNDLNYYYWDFEKQVQEIREARDSIGKMSTNPPSNFRKVILNMSLFWYYNNLNFLMLDDFKGTHVFYQDSLDIIIQGLSLRESGNKDEINGPFQKVKLDSIPYFVLYTMVSNCEPSKIFKMFKQKSITELKFTEEEYNGKTTYELIMQAFNNIIEDVGEIKYQKNHKYLNNIISLLSFVRLGTGSYEKVLASIVNLIRKEDLPPMFYFDFFIVVYNFIGRQKEFFNEQVPANEMYDLLEVVISVLVKNAFDIRTSDGVSLAELLSSYLSKSEKSREINNDIIIELLSYNMHCVEHDRVITAMYKISSEEFQKKINTYIINRLDSIFDIDLYSSACMNKIIEPNERYEKQLISSVQDVIEDSANGRRWPSPIIHAYAVLINYVIACKVISRKDFEIFKGRHAIFDLLYDPENVDFEDFDLSELKIFHDSAYAFFDDYPSVKEKLKTALTKYLREHPEDKELIRVYFKFFVD